MHDQSIGARGDAYRRGVVLGLTVAEIMLLLIFVLLLGFGFQLLAQTATINDQEFEIAKLQRAIAGVGDLANRQERLTQAIELLDEWQAQNPKKDLDQFFYEMSDKAQALDELEGLISKHYGEIDSLKELEGAIQSSIEAETYFNELVEQSGIDPATEELPPASELADLAQQILERDPSEDRLSPADLERQVENLKGQVVSLQGRLQQEGNGRVLPSCWTTPQGRSEYIFNIRLTSSSLEVAETNLPHRAKERALLPIRSFGTEDALSNEAFVRASEGLFKWSEQNNCRFYVRVRDATLAHEKSVYRSRLNAVERHFYKFEIN